MQTFDELIAAATEEGHKLDIRVCGGSEKNLATAHNEVKATEKRAERKRRVEIYREQVVMAEDGGYNPPEGGFELQPVDDLAQWNAELNFCAKLIRDGLMEPFDD